MVRRGYGLAGAVIRVIGLIIVGILVIHIILTLLGANPDNAFASFIRVLAGGLSLGLSNLFLIGDQKVNVLVNYGIAAVVWLLIVGIIVAIVRRVD